MRSSKKPTFLFSSPSVLSDRDLEKLTCSIRMTARGRDFSRRRTDRYQAWILVFVSWCLRSYPHQVHRDRIGAFRSALSKHPDTGIEEVCDAMDALGFFFGAVDEVQDIFPATPRGADEPDSANGTKVPDLPSIPVSSPNRLPSEEDAISTIRLGWQDREDLSQQTSPSSDSNKDTKRKSLEISDEVAQRLQRLSVQLGLPPQVLASRAIDLVCDEIGEPEERQSTTKRLVQQYQTQLDLLHSVQSHSEEEEPEDAEEEDDPYWWNAVDEIIDAGERSQHSGPSA